LGLSADGRTLVRLGDDDGSVDVSGLTSRTRLVAIDYRPSDGLLYGLASDGQLYTIDGDGSAHVIGIPQEYGDMSSGAAIDFNPQVDAIRVLTIEDGRNFVTNALLGVPAEFTTSAFAEEDANAGITPIVAATAYDNSVSPFPEGGETVQYSIEAEANVLAIQGKNAGTLETVAGLGFDVTEVASLDISGETGNAYALLTSDDTQRYYAIDLEDGALTVLEVDVPDLIDVTIIPGGIVRNAPAMLERAWGLSGDGERVLELGTSIRTTIRGLNPDTALLGLDYRPADDKIYALGDDGQLYTLTTGGTATAVGTPQTYGDLSAGVTMDINAQVDAIRVVMTADGRNFVTNATAGTTEEFTTSAYVDGDDNAGTMPMVAATAYDLSVSPFPEDGSATTQYSLEAEANLLAIQGKNAGTLETVAVLPLDFTEIAGLDISGATGDAYALLSIGNAQGLFRIDLETGGLTRLGLGVGNVRDFTIVPQ
jgi:hypothetical protein